MDKLASAGQSHRIILSITTRLNSTTLKLKKVKLVLGKSWKTYLFTVAIWVKGIINFEKSHTGVALITCQRSKSLKTKRSEKRARSLNSKDDCLFNRSQESHLVKVASCSQCSKTIQSNPKYRSLKSRKDATAHLTHPDMKWIISKQKIVQLN